MIPEQKPTGCFVGFTAARSPLSWLIRKVTRSKWSHCFVAFEFRDGTARRTYYYESLFAIGVVGPKPLSKLRDWIARGDGECDIQLLHAPALVVDAPKFWDTKRAIAESYVGHAGYGELQLLAMWAFERFGWRVPRSPGRVVCSEFVARVLFPEFDLRSEGREFDEVTPESLWKKLQGELT